MTQDNRILKRKPDSVMLRTLQGRINRWNRGSEKLYGWKKEEAIGRISHDLLKTRFPKPLKEIDSDLVTSGQWQGELVHSTREGRPVVVESRWRLAPRGRSSAVVEINVPSSDHALDDSAGKQQALPTTQSAKTENLSSKFANGVLAAGALACLTVFFYLVYHYGWTGERQFSSPLEVVLYWILPAVLAGICFGFLKQSQEFKVNAAIVCVSVAFAIYATEFTLGFISSSASRSAVTFWGDVPATHREEIVALAKKSGIDFDTRTKFDVVKDLRNRGTAAVPAIVPLELLVRQPDGNFKSQIAIQGTDVLPLTGISNHVTVLCNETGRYSIYDSDQRGFHNPKAIWQSSSVAIVAVGDSFTSGACVPSDKNFVALLRERHESTLNLGMLGNGPLAMLGALKEYLPVVKPKVVLWFFYEENDFRDLLKESKTPLLMSYLQDHFNQDLFNRQADIDQALTAYVEQVFDQELTKQNNKKDTADAWKTLEGHLKLSHLRQRLGLIREGNPGGNGEYNEAQLNLFRTVLSQAKEAVEGWGGTLYFVYLPARERYSNEQNYNRDLVLAGVKDLAIPVIDIHRSFQKNDDPLSFFPFRRFGHYNEAGNRVVAEEVLRSIALKSP
jgi:PAS domain S-box-containing protein